MAEYETYMMKTITRLQEEKFTHSVFGDIFLEDLKIYREQQLSKVGITAVFPLWKRDTTELISEFIDLGFKTIIVCVNEKYLDKSFCGRIIDESFINELPKDVDVCGENGEFHTFVFDGPTFKNPVAFTKGEIVHRKYAAPKQPDDNCFQQAPAEDYGFYFCDLLPA
jgi:Predicted ATPases of PP-loop superfamily